MFKLMAIFAYVALGAVLVSIYRRERAKSEQPDEASDRERPEPNTSAAPTPLPEERRNEARWLTRRVSVMIADADTRKVLTRATIYDRSANGMRLVAERNLDSGARLFICPAHPGQNNATAKVEVRFCQRSDDGWLLGCKFTEPLTEEASARFG
jgi:PilZ domain-containing protein